MDLNKVYYIFSQYGWKSELPEDMSLNLPYPFPSVASPTLFQFLLPQTVPVFECLSCVHSLALLHSGQNSLSILGMIVFKWNRLFLRTPNEILSHSYFGYSVHQCPLLVVSSSNMNSVYALSLYF